jgi:hypothetical protein
VNRMTGSIERILGLFVDESFPEGGIDASKSLWQKPGKGSASGSDMFPGKVDVRYLRFLVEVLYREAKIEEHGVKWVTHGTSIDPLVNVGWLWVSAVLGILNGRDLGFS